MHSNIRFGGKSETKNICGARIDNKDEDFPF